MKTIVISDIHLGLDDAFSECVANRPLLVSFLNRLVTNGEIDELVIAGDFLDQWFYPGNISLPANSAKFYHQVAANNRTVFKALNALMAANIKLVYVPGNHDMTLSADVLDELLPGIVQARDACGLGTYRTGLRGEIAIEHSHRYELFCAPDLFSNKSLVSYGNPILPPGYFYARLGVTSLLEGYPAVTKKLPRIPRPAFDNTDQLAASAYAEIWNNLINKRFPVKETFEDPFIQVNVDGFNGAFSLADLVPHLDEDDLINALLYENIQRRWDQVQQVNHVAIPCTALQGMLMSTDLVMRDTLPQTQYFNLDPTIEVVVFGHTHIPILHESRGEDGSLKIFANSGTWVDHNFDAPEHTATYVLIESDERGSSVQLLKCSGEGSVKEPVSVF